VLTLDSIYPVKLSDQSRPEAIDLMYARTPTAYGADTKGSVEVVFEHQLTKLVFLVTRGAKITSLSGLSLELEDVALTTNFNLSSARLADGGIGGTDRLSAKIVSATTDEARAEAIVLPMKDLDDTKIYLSITLDGSSYSAILPRPDDAATAALEAGYFYTYNVLLNKDGISLSGKLTPWNEGGTGIPQFTEVHPPSLPIEIPLSAKIPAGTFRMGSPLDEVNRSANEYPHEVTLTEDFYMSKYEITNTQYAAFLNATGVDDTGQGTVDGSTRTLIGANAAGVEWSGTDWQPASGRENHPVIMVSWYGAKAFADWIGGSLPTEAQWEYACRAGTTTAWYFGNDDTDAGEYAWIHSNAGNTTHPVGEKKPNAWGLYDMCGNVSEWCYDWYLNSYTSLPTFVDPKGPATGTKRIARGGNWTSANTIPYRSAHREQFTPIYASTIFGFRIVVVP
jgi:formylglycine-generating enzyme required for sulfatase activity